MHDTTQWRVARDAADVEASYGRLLDSTPDAIVMVNQTGHIVLANTHAYRLFGYDSGALEGQPIEFLLPQRFRDAHRGHRSAYRAQPRARAMGMGLELYGLRRDGTEFPVEISLSPVETNDTTLVVSAIRDMTERKRVQLELQQKNAELEAANRAKDMFLAHMSHELRTPLHSIIGFTGTLLMGLPGPLTADQLTQLRTVQSSALHLLSLINELLDLARIDAGKFEPTYALIDLGRVAGEAIDSLRQQAEARGLDVGIDLPRSPLTIRSDARAVKQILINLVGNAIKFTPAGNVGLEVVPPGDGESHVHLRVTDSGPGIPPADRERIFEPFERLETPASLHNEGSGLGLHLSRRLAEQIGGRLHLDEEYGGGSCFVLTLPVE